MQQRKVAVRGGMFDIEVLEGGSGDPVLFLHGEAGLRWDAFLEALAGRYRVIAPSHPGFGESTGNEHLLDLHDLIYYYLDFLDTLELRSLPVIGHSLGGMFAAELAAVQPDRFSRLVLIAPLGLWNAAYPVMDFFTATPAELSAALYHDPTSPAAVTAAQPPKEGEAMISFMLERAKSLATAAKYLWPIPNRGLNKRIHRIAAPTLLIWGESDGLCPPRYGEDFQALIPDARLETIQEAGHLPQVEQPEKLAELVMGFLASSGK